MVTDSATGTPATHPRTYDYGSLVDRWYSVYDRHYRSQTAEPAFWPTKYTSAWNEEGLGHGTVAGGALGLEDLRRVTLEGMGASGISAPRVHGEGEYRTMPLEGRFDLIRPRTRAERMQAQAQEDRTETPESTPMPEEPSATPAPSTPLAQILSLAPDSPVRWTTLPTPGIDEIPPAPHARLISLPPTPLRYVPAPYKPLRFTREVGAQTVPIQPQQREPGKAGFALTPPMSNFAIETPPSVVTPAPMDTYFPKVWDIDRSWSSVSPSSSETSLTTMDPSPSKPQPTSSSLFTPSLVPATPDMLRSQGQYGNIGEENRSSTPDFTNVKRVFPWEERPRHTPGRIFPDEGSPLTTFRRIPVPATPERRVTFRSPMPSPLAGFPPSFQPHYRSDGQFQQRQASRIMWSVPSSSPLGLRNELAGVETGSRDGDVEDEVDSEEETMMKSRSSSIEMAKRIPKYRSIGVQTDPRELCGEGVQVMTFTPVTEEAEKRFRRNWLTATGTTSPSVMTKHISTSSPLSSPVPDSHRSSLPPNPDDLGASNTRALGEAGETSSSSSVSSSPTISSLAPAGSPPPSHSRKGSRMWDPARGVEAFKRGSEEVLAKFMKRGSRGERA